MSHLERGEGIPLVPKGDPADIVVEEITFGGAYEGGTLSSGPKARVSFTAKAIRLRLPVAVWLSGSQRDSSSPGSPDSEIDRASEVGGWGLRIGGPGHLFT
jgi:hypothetical protein